VFQWVEEVKNVKAVVKKSLRVVKSPDESIKTQVVHVVIIHFLIVLPTGFSIPNFSTQFLKPHGK